MKARRRMGKSVGDRVGDRASDRVAGRLADRVADRARVESGGQRQRIDAAVPRYVAIASELMAAIADGRYPIGQALPTEHELCQQFGISRFTVREALRQLAEAGLVTRRPRAGTIVVSRSRRQPYVQTLGSIGDLLQYSADTELKIAKFGSIVVEPALALELSMPAGQTWIVGLGVRHRKGGDQPVCVTRVYLNSGFRGIARHLARDPGPIYMAIEQHYGVRVARIEQRIDAVALSRDDAALLKVKPGAPALRIVRRYYDADDRLLEVSDSLHPAERFGYAMTIHRAGLAPPGAGAGATSARTRQSAPGPTSGQPGQGKTSSSKEPVAAARKRRGASGSRRSARP